MRIIYILILVFMSMNSLSQDEMPLPVEDQSLEEQADWLEDIYQKLDQYKNHPLDLNTITLDELNSFPFITSLQIEQFISYRKLLGPFLELLEIQAVPGWDVETIRRFLPYVEVNKIGTRWENMQADVRKNDQLFVYRSNFKDLLDFSKTKNSGSSLLRYRISSNSFQAGFQFEKDKGERWWDKQKGLPFISGYLSVKFDGFIKGVFVGDYLIGLGQGLVLAQGRGVVKTSASMLIKRQSSNLLPLRSTEENRFMRGVALQFGHKKFNGLFFASYNKIDGNVIRDSMIHKTYISSLQTSGFHISPSEIQDWDAIKILSIGFRMEKKIHNGNICINHVFHQFDNPITKQIVPYTINSMGGKSFNSYSIDFGKTIRNAHIFGEVAVDGKKQLAMILGGLVSLQKNLDLSIHLRNYGTGYHSYLSKSLSENSEPSNEKGVYWGLACRLLPSLSLDAYTDIFKFPWLKYRIDRPSSGHDHLIQLVWKPDKKTIFTIRYKSETKYINQDMNRPVHWVGLLLKNGLRTQMEHHPNLHWKWRARVEYTTVYKEWNVDETGMLFFFDLFWDRQDFSISGRLMYCKTEGFDSRIYAYENDVLYYGHVSQFQGSTIRSYVNLEMRVTKKCTLYTKISNSFITTELVVRF